MIKYIILKEIRYNLISPVFVATFVLSFIVIILSIYMGLLSFNDQVIEYSQMKIINRKELNDKTYYSEIGAQGLYVSKPPEILGVLVAGVENITGRYVLVNMTNNPRIIGSKVEGNPIFAIFGELDLMFVVKNVFSLIIVLLTYSTISGEKEGGTLRLIFSNPIPRDSLILGKMAGNFLCLMACLAIPTLLGIALFVSFQSVHLTYEGILRLLCILGVFFLYITCFFSLGMFISTLSSRSLISFLALLFIWITYIMVIPKGSVILASQFAQVPSIQHYYTQVSQVQKDIRKQGSRELNQYHSTNPRPRRPQIKPSISKGEREAILAAYRQSVDEWRERRIAKSNEIREKVRDKWQTEQSKLDQIYKKQRDELIRVATNLSRISPASAMNYASMSLAGTGIEQQGMFLTQVRAYQSVFINYIKKKIEDEGGRIYPDGHISLSRSNMDSPIDLSDMPVFQYRQKPFREVIESVMFDSALIVLFSLLFFTGAYFSFLRYDVR